MRGLANTGPIKDSRKKCLSIQRILAAAEVEFGRHGLANAKIEAIARTAGLSAQLVFHYFGSKEALYSEVLSKIAVECSRFVDDFDFESMSSWDAIDCILFNIIDKNSQIGFRFIADQLINRGLQMSSDNVAPLYQRKLIELMDRVLARGRIERAFSEGPDARQMLVAIVTMSIGYATAESVIINPDLVDVDEGNARAAWTKFAVSFFKSALRA